MSLEPAGSGEDLAFLRKQFRKAIIEAGPLKGAKFLDVGLADLSKASKSYKSDARFQQFAKRMMAIKTLGQESEEGTKQNSNSQNFSGKFFHWMHCGRVWMLQRLRARTLTALVILLAILTLFSRPMLYVVASKALTLSVKVVLRRTFGTVSLVFDAILEEVSDQIDLALLPPVQIPMTVEPETLRQNLVVRDTQVTSFPWLFNLICMTVSFAIGRRWRPT